MCSYVYYPRLIHSGLVLRTLSLIITVLVLQCWFLDYTIYYRGMYIL